MNKKDKFFMLLALSCLPLSEMAAEQVDGMAVSPITQEVLQNSVKITGKEWMFKENRLLVLQ